MVLKEEKIEEIDPGTKFIASVDCSIILIAITQELNLKKQINLKDIGEEDKLIKKCIDHIGLIEEKRYKRILNKELKKVKNYLNIEKKFIGNVDIDIQEEQKMDEKIKSLDDAKSSKNKNEMQIIKISDRFGCLKRAGRFFNCFSLKKK